MKKIERRAFVCLALALLLAAGLGFFLVKYFLDGGSWASSAFNRHLYNSSGQLASGTVLDRDGDVLSEVVDGQRTYYDNATVRKATLHAVGDLQGNIGTGALNAFADKLTGLTPGITIPPMRRLAASPAPWRSTTTKPERFCVWSQPPATTP